MFSKILSSTRSKFFMVLTNITNHHSSKTDLNNFDDSITDYIFIKILIFY